MSASKEQAYNALADVMNYAVERIAQISKELEFAVDRAREHRRNI